MAIDPKLREFATERQCQFLDAIEEHGSERKAAAALSLSHGTISNALASLKKNAARMGYSPEHHMTHAVPDGFFLRGTSTYINKDGQVAGQWVKNQIDHDRQREIFEAAAAAMAETLPRAKAAPAPARTDAALCNLYTFTDSHVGMLAWSKETGGEDWDLKIAERTLTAAFAHMVDAAPKADVGFIAQLGDWMHSDGSNGMSPVTPTSHHVVDQDGRYAKMVGCAIRVLRRIVDFALEKHNRVVVLMAEGNHDISSSVWLRAMFRALYENEPRVTVIDSEMPYYVYQHGKTMLAFHHGHLKKVDQLPLLFAAQFPKMWGETTRRYAHTGHLHHVDEKEHSGIIVIQHPTLASRDAYAARGGWISERSATVITYHAEYGQVARNTVVPEMFDTV